MSKEYRLSIVVSGKDNGARSMLGGLGGALGSVGKIASGILAADVLKKVASGIFEIGKKSISATADVQRMGMMLESLQARELKRAGTLENLNGYVQQNLGLTEAQGERLVALRTTYDNLLSQQQKALTMGGAESQNYKDITAAIENYRAKIILAAEANGALSPTQRATILNQLSMNDALTAAAPLAKATMNELERIAVLSPYQMESVQNSYKLAMAFGFTSKEATSFTKSILNVAAGTGASNEMLDRMAYNLAQVRLQGKVTQMDIRQLAMAGFDLVDVLKFTGQQMGVNIKDHHDFNAAIASGKITWEDFALSFEKYADTNFGGASERMSKSLSGLGSSFQDVFAILAPKALGKPLERITGWLGGLLDKILLVNGSGALEDLGTRLDNLLVKIEKMNLVDVDSMLKDLFGMDVNQMAADQMIDEATSPTEKRMLKKEMQLEMELMPKVEKKGLDPALMFNKIGAGWMGLTQKFQDMMQGVDWESLSVQVASSIESIDWNSLGNMFMLGVMDLIEGLWAFLSGVDWGLLFLTIGNAVGEFIIGLFGLTVPQFIELVASTFNQMKMTAETKLDEFKGSMFAKFLLIAGTVAAALSNLPAVVAIGLLGVLTQFAFFKANVALKMREIAKTFHARAVGWMQQIIQGVQSMVGSVINAISGVIDRVIAAIRPIVIPVSFGSPGNAPGGGGGSVGNSGGGGPGQGGNRDNRNDGFARGGIATGSNRGHWELLHGTEAVIPLQGGSIPVSLAGGASGTVINVVLNYAPFVSLADQNEAREKLAPFIADELRLLLPQRS
jgi:tape measure domain-containing protein